MNKVISHANGSAGPGPQHRSAEMAARFDHLQRLQEAIGVLPDGVAFFDADDRLVTWNDAYGDLCTAGGITLRQGMTFTGIVRALVRAGSVPAEADALRSLGSDVDTVLRTNRGRWVKASRRQTPDGGAIRAWTDVTDLKEAEEAAARARDKAAEAARRAEIAEAAAGLGHWRLDCRTDEVTWSTQLYRIYGFEPGSAVDVDRVMAMTHPDDRDRVDARISRQLSAPEGDAEERNETRVVRDDGELRYLSGMSRVERDADGAIIALMGTAQDVTEQRRAEQAIAASEERFRRLAVHAPDIIAESRLDGTMTYISPASLAITGFAPEELVGRPFTDLMEPEDGAKVRAMCQAVFGSKGAIQPWPVEFRARHKDGRQIWLECKPTLVADKATGRFVGLTDVIRDITPRKQLEAELRAARAEAESAAAVKSEFLANMSHELRTPLTSIIGFTGLARQQPGLSDLSRRYIDKVGDASQALLCTVNDILDFSKLEAGQVAIHRRPERLRPLLQSALELFMPQAGAKDLSLTLEAEDAEIAIDPDRLRQILLNLVGNAVKFTAAGGVTLRARYDCAAERLAVEVEDTGEGIAPDKLDRLFQRFSQVDGSLTRQGGTGLGLAICKGLAEAMGGRIGVQSTPGRGSRFWFEISAPPAAAPAEDGIAPGEDRPAFEGLRVLVADDHPNNRELARLYLSAVGAEISEVVDGREACALAARLPFDVILMDLRMPNLDGLEAMRCIRGGGGCNDATPIVAITADADTAQRDRLLAEGFDDVVAKPLDPGTLLRAVVRAASFAEVAETPHASRA